MGRLIHNRHIRLHSVVIIIICLAITGGWIFMQQKNQERQLHQLAQEGKVQVGVEVVNDFQQVYIQRDGIVSFITEGLSNHTAAAIDKSLVAWVATPSGANTSLIYIYNIFTNETQQLTYAGSHSRPTVRDGQVAWEDHTASVSKVGYFNGSRVFYLGDGTHAALRPAIGEDQIVYVQSLNATTYQLVSYKPSTATTTILKKVDSYHAFPQFREGKLIIDQPY